jgi:hypothetical protein
VYGCKLAHAIRIARCSRAKEQILVVEDIWGKVLGGAGDSRQQFGDAGFEFIFELENLDIVQREI